MEQLSVSLVLTADTYHHQFICHIFISNCRYISCNGRPPEKHIVHR